MENPLVLFLFAVPSRLPRLLPPTTTPNPHPGTTYSTRTQDRTHKRRNSCGNSTCASLLPTWTNPTSHASSEYSPSSHNDSTRTPSSHPHSHRLTPSTPEDRLGYIGSRGQISRLRSTSRRLYLARTGWFSDDIRRRETPQPVWIGSRRLLPDTRNVRYPRVIHKLSLTVSLGRILPVTPEVSPTRGARTSARSSPTSLLRPSGGPLETEPLISVHGHPRGHDTLGH